MNQPKTEDGSTKQGKDSPYNPKVPEGAESLGKGEKPISISHQEGDIRVVPTVVGDERTVQLVIVCLTILSMFVIGVNAYNGSVDVETIILPIITGITGLLGGSAMRK